MPDSFPHLHVVILAGGSGTRFWPLSREKSPKQMLTVFDEESLLASTVRRARRLTAHPIHIFTSVPLLKEVSSHLLGCAAAKPAELDILAEPAPRDTAFAIALAAAYLKHRDPNAIMLVLPSDHHVIADERWDIAVARAYRIACEDHIATMGATPDRVATGYGYIKPGRPIKGIVGANTVDQFVEKPDAITARRLIREGYLWNTGIFMMRASLVLSEMRRAGAEKLTPEASSGQQIAETANFLASIGTAHWNHPDAREVVGALTSVSFDKAVLEVSDNVTVVPTTFEWSDVGSLSSLDELTFPDADGNRTIGRGVTIASKNTTVYSENRLIATLGLKDAIVVDTPDATLVASKDSLQSMRSVVAALTAIGAEEAITSRVAPRPWGSWRLLCDGDGFRVKRIEVLPGRRLSLQMHKHRSEHWIVVSGIATVQRNDTTFQLPTGSSTFIEAGTRHRLANDSSETLTVIEVAAGSYLGEDDIVRYEDDWSREL